jgi:hypothetical protein
MKTIQVLNHLTLRLEHQNELKMAKGFDSYQNFENIPEKGQI